MQISVFSVDYYANLLNTEFDTDAARIGVTEEVFKKRCPVTA
jgi:hypothetical protein